MPRIELLEMIGTGGYGSVFLADVTRGGVTQRRAIKVLHGELASEAGRQRDEARMLGQLNHDGVVKLIELTSFGGMPALIMEYVEGVDFDAILDQRLHPSPRAALEVIEQAANALNAAWATLNRATGRPLRLIHRDIKPGNLMLTVSGQVKILDFGVARADIEREGKTATQLRLGTVRYMAPEHQLQNVVSHKVDVYALGLVLAQLLAGQQVKRLPLDRDEHERFVRDLAASVVPEGWGPEVSKELRELLTGMLAWDPEERPHAGAVDRRAVALVDKVRGESLRSFAKRVVPELIDRSYHEVPADMLRRVPRHDFGVLWAVLLGAGLALLLVLVVVVATWIV